MTPTSTGRAVLVQTAYGPMLVPPYDEYVAQSLIRTGVFSSAEWDGWVPYLSADAVVWEVGANIGAHTLAFASTCRTVEAWEPQLALYRMLCGSLALGGGRNVTLHNAAVGTAQTVSVPQLDVSAPANFGGVAMGHGSVDVPCVPLPTGPCDFLKIDVEGAELDVLATLQKDTRPVIVAEADRPGQLDAVSAWLRDRGYVVGVQRAPLGPLWPKIISLNVVGVPSERPWVDAPHIVKL